MGSCLCHPYSLGLFSLREMWVRKVGHNGNPPDGVQDGVFHGSPQMWNRFCVFLPWCVGRSCWLQSGLVDLIWAVVFESEVCRSPLPGVGKPAMVVVRVQGAPASGCLIKNIGSFPLSRSHALFGVTRTDASCLAQLPTGFGSSLDTRTTRWQRVPFSLSQVVPCAAHPRIK